MLSVYLMVTLLTLEGHETSNYARSWHSWCAPFVALVCASSVSFRIHLKTINKPKICCGAWLASANLPIVFGKRFTRLPARPGAFPFFILLVCSVARNISAILLLNENLLSS
jgi:hypothetical protein